MTVIVTATEGVDVPSPEAELTWVSFDAVFVEEHVAMVRLAYLLLGSESLAEEAVQDAFARLLDRFETVANPGGFVRTATMNRCRDLLRRRKREQRIQRLFRPPRTVELGADDLADVLAGLSERRHEVIVLRFYLGHTTSEIAELLGIPEGAVRSTMHRALQDLRGVLSRPQPATPTEPSRLRSKPCSRPRLTVSTHRETCWLA